MKKEAPVTNEYDKVMRTLAPMFRRAEQEGLWFYSVYQGLWFSPESLRRQQEKGNFRWGAVNWDLRDPRKRIAELRAQGKAAYDQAEALEAELRPLSR